jgi:hypothetical protein
MSSNSLIQETALCLKLDFDFTKKLRKGHYSYLN